MIQEINAVNVSDVKGNPTGGHVEARGIEIHWQDGPIDREASLNPNGAFVEGVIEAARQRLEYFQSSKFKCRENALAITKLEEALHWLNHRTLDREKRHVEGTYEI